ncbi:uroporphyrinogen-III synthase [Undibacterium pigrum]|uniref:Uroporphyrinogen-III synthase n=1 Tax=Undibacterium pigrum TaxID=401470 RepID=A0A318JCH4_9BURK|nr:uroporphyrinogen-III synthase [Undibacterium pigrum]PXX46611.1 uroporphyrinogen-III synthase [Undibacterium pigrum]
MQNQNVTQHAHARQVVLTRPWAQAQDFARQVQAMGRAVAHFPLLEIEALEDNTALIEQLGRLQDYALIAFVSPNAIDAFFRHLTSLPPELTFAVMGEGSRTKLAEYGVNDQTATVLRPRNVRKTDSETLLAELDLDALRGQKVLIVRGESGRELLADALRAHGIEVVQVAAYRRVKPTLNDENEKHLAQLLENQNDWIITSSEALRNLCDYVAGLNLIDGVAKMQRQHLLVPHSRIEETAKSLGFLSITLTASGDEQLLVALQSRL